eukprot:SAG22_NODE_1285_length_4874_cov_2.729634_2_plen_340_part_00
MLRRPAHCSESELHLSEYVFGTEADEDGEQPLVEPQPETSPKRARTVASSNAQAGTSGSTVVRVLSDGSECWGGSCGSSVWAAAPVLCKWLLRTSPPCACRAMCGPKDKAVLELGAGLGMVGMACAKAGASEVLLTDLPQQLPLMRRNIAENFGEGCYVDCAALPWGGAAETPLPRPAGGLRAGWDLVVGADLVYDIGAMPALACTLARLLLARPVSRGEEARRGPPAPRALCAFPDRTDFQHRPARVPAAGLAAEARRPLWVGCGIADRWWPDAEGLVPDFELLFELLAEQVWQQADPEPCRLVVTQVAAVSAEDAGTLDSAIHIFILELRLGAAAAQ